MPKGQEEQGKAAEEKKPASVPTSNFKDSSGAKFDENVDVSDAALAKLNAEIKAGRGQEKVAEKKAIADDDAKKDEEKSNDGKDEETLDSASEAILNEIASQKESDVKKSEGQTESQRIAELERKNKELYNENQSFKSKQNTEENKETQPVLYENMSPEQKQAFEDWVDKEYEMTVPEFQKQLKFQHAFMTEYIDPRLSGIDKKFSDSELQKRLGDNKLYNALKNEVEEVVKNDSRLAREMDRGMPKDVAYSLAMDIVQKNNMPKIAKAIAEKEYARAKLNKRVIINDGSTAGVKDTKKSGITFDNKTKDTMKSLDLDESDIEKYGGKNLVLK